jgi:hypothetical protein
MLKAYWGVNTEYVTSLAVTSDWGSVMTGYEIGQGALEYDGLVVKVDACGELMWSKAYGSVLTDAINKVTISSTGSIVFVGLWTNVATSRTAIFLGEINHVTGKLIRAVAYPGAEVSSVHGNDLALIDDRIVVAGTATSAIGTKAVVKVVDWTGGVLLTYEATGLLSSSYQAVARLNNGHFIAVGKLELSAGFWVGLVSRYNSN